MSHKTILIWVTMLWAGASGLYAQATATTTVRGRVEVTGAGGSGKDAGKRGKKTIPKAVVWLTPLASPASETTAVLPSQLSAPLRLVQKHKSFEPHILVVPAGSMVEFPNHDPFFHNVFSLFEGKRFDLGLYEAGTSRMVRFDRPGVSYIFCNIHPEMSAVIITLATPLYAITNSDGQISLADVPYGRYILHIWSEGMGPENAQPLTREITIGENASSLGVVRVPPATGQRIAHKNKYGRDYEEPTPNSSVYNQQR
jgi:plastocyanin